MKILYWVGYIGDKFGAYEKYVVLFAKHCKARGHKLIVLHEGPNNVGSYRNALNELDTEYVSIPHSLKEPQQGIQAAIFVIRKYQPDIVHFNFTNPLIMPLAKLLRVPLVYRTCHNGILKVTARTKISRMMNNLFIDRFFSVSQRVRNDEIRAGVRKDRLLLNYLGVPIQDYVEQNTLTADEPLPFSWNEPQTRKIITVGRFFPEKGMRFVTEVAVETMCRFSNVIWWMVGGTGPDYESCKDIVIQSHFEDRIIFLGQRNDVPALLKQSYVQVVGSLFEGLPLNVLEASILGVPTLGPNIKGLDEAIQNNQTGFLVESRTVERFVAAISLLFDNPRLRDQMGEHARSFVIAKHNSSYWIEQLMDIYEHDYRQKMDQPARFPGDVDPKQIEYRK
jgi:glycosyltransferase involved in cell wall biosynthesis